MGALELPGLDLRWSKLGANDNGRFRPAQSWTQAQLRDRRTQLQTKLDEAVAFLQNPANPGQPLAGLVNYGTASNLRLTKSQRDTIAACGELTAGNALRLDQAIAATRSYIAALFALENFMAGFNCGGGCPDGFNELQLPERAHQMAF